jgi:1,6-anhydro-N-acetylmuramate kinase
LLLKATKFETAIRKDRSIAVNADSQLERRLVLCVDNLLKRNMMRFPGNFMIGHHGLEMLHQPVNDRAAQDQQQAERRQEQPAVVHGRSVIHRFQKLARVHICHILSFQVLTSGTAPLLLFTSAPNLESIAWATCEMIGRVSPLL